MIRSKPSLTTAPAQSQADVRHFFDSFAAFNTEQHGTADRLLDYRIKVLHQFAAFRTNDVVLDIGCGDGKHLFALDGKIARGIGIDLSPNMVAFAAERSHYTTTSQYAFYVDNAESLEKIPPTSVDVVICTGALEHMLNKKAVLHAIRRVLKPGGRFVCLTLNDQFFWYNLWAPAINHPTYHLATDKRINAKQAEHLLSATGFTLYDVDFWTFIPRGDMPPIAASACSFLDKLGHIGASRWLRSGLVLSGIK